MGVIQMKKSTKLLALLLTFAFMLFLTSCSSSSGGDGGQESQPGGDSEKETLVMATNAEFPPYEFYQGEQVTGIDAEIGAAIAEKLGMNFEISDMEFDSIIPAIQAGKAQIGMAGMTVTEDRLEEVDFSDSYATGVQVIIVPEDSPITSADDLFKEGANNVIGVQLATTGDIYCTDDYGADHVVPYDNGITAVQALMNDQVDCVVIDNAPAKEFVAANAGLTILDTEYALEDYAIGFAKGNTALVEAVNGALAELIGDGTVQAILDKYIAAE